MKIRWQLIFVIFIAMAGIIPDCGYAKEDKMAPYQDYLGPADAGQKSK